MESKKGISFTFLIIAIIVGNGIYKQFDFETLKFDKPAIAIIYIICFVFSIYILIKNYSGSSKKNEGKAKHQ